MNIKCKNRKGQAILFAVVGVTIALAIGVTVASRNLSSISRISRSDTSERAFAAAEGGIEKLLILSGSELESISVQAAGACGLVGGTPAGAYCEITYPIVTGDPIISVANVKVERYSSNETYGTTSYLSLDINNGDMAEVTLVDSVGAKFSGNLTLCWQNTEAAIFYTFYNYYSGSDYKQSKGALRSSDNSAVFPNRGDTSDNGFSTISGGSNGFSRCTSFDMTSASNQYDGLRIRAMFKRTLVGIFGSNSLPDQGYKLTSLGEISGQTEIIKKVVAYRSYPFMPSIFDAAIFSPGGQIN